MVNVTVAAGDRPDFEEEAAALVRRAVEHEREECAQLCEDLALKMASSYLGRHPTIRRHFLGGLHHAAHKIRERGTAADVNAA